MCGIAGILSATAHDAGSLEATAASMAEALTHRGPDDEGSWRSSSAPLAFGFRRLSIFDTSALGHQPMVSESGRFVIVFNGEVYNHPELRAELEAQGARFRSRSDTEVLLAGFEHWGVTETLARSRGMFAIGLWDIAERKLWLARDRLGIKPLFLYKRGGTIAFSSELKSFHRIPGRSLTVDPCAALSFLTYLYVPAPDCIYKEVRKVTPGSWVRISPDDLTVDEGRYWSLGECVRRGAENPFVGSPEEAVAECRRVLTEAIALRLRADVPVGAFLSGGVDSTAVTSIAQSLSGHPVRTFTVSFDHADYDEGPYAAEVAKRLGTAHTEVRMGDGDLLREVPRMAWMFDEPFADPSQLPTSLVSQVARRDVTVSLSGDGGDEVFAGYQRYLRGLRLLATVRSRPLPQRRFASAVLDAVPSRVWDSPLGKLFLGWQGVSRQHSLSHRARVLASALRSPDPLSAYRQLLAINPAAAELVTAPETMRPLSTSLSGPQPSSDLRRMLLADQGGYVQDDLLCKLDRVSMAASLEARVPLLDHKLVELSWALPDEVFVRGGVGKWPLRQILLDFMPPEVIDRPKMGFSVPLAKWLRGPLREWAEDLIAPEAIREVGLLARSRVEASWRRFVGGKDTEALSLWAVLQLQAWGQEWGATPG